MGVQKVGGLGNDTPVGRVGDDAGILFRVDLTSFSSATLAFDWRNFAAAPSDKIVVGYHVGDDLGFGPSTPVIDFLNDPSAGNGSQAQVEAWWASEWTQLLKANSGTWQSESFDLATGDVLYIAFWIDNGDADFAKLESVLVTGTAVPEAGMGMLLVAGLVGLGGRRR